MKILRYIFLMFLLSHNINTSADTFSIPEKTINSKEKQLTVLKTIKNIGILSISITAACLLLFMIRKKISQNKKYQQSILKGRDEESLRIAKEIHDNITSGINILIKSTNKKENKSKLISINTKMQKLSHRLNIKQVDKNNFNDILIDFIPPEADLKHIDFTINKPGDYKIEDKKIKKIYLKLINKLINFSLEKNMQTSMITINLSIRKNKYFFEYKDDSKFISERKDSHIKRIKEITQQLNTKIKISSDQGLHVLLNA